MESSNRNNEGKIKSDALSYSTIETPKDEIDVMPESISRINKDDSSSLSPKEKRDWLKWLKNLDFMKWLLALLIFLYIIDLIVTKGNSPLRDPLFEVLKVILFTVSGYLFAKSTD